MQRAKCLESLVVGDENAQGQPLSHVAIEISLTCSMITMYAYLTETYLSNTNLPIGLEQARRRSVGRSDDAL